MTTHIDDDMLQALHDGELEASAAAQALEHAERCGTCTAKLERMERLGKLLRSAAEDGNAGVDFDAMFARIESSGPVDRPAIVRSIDEARARRRAIVVPIALVAAAAAAVLVALGPWNDSGPPETARARPTTRAPMAIAAVESPPAGSEVVNVDFGTNTGTVFAIEAGAGSSVAVVWIDEGAEVQP